MANTPAKPKPRSWRKKTDPQCCIGCEQEFRRADKIYEVGCLALHAKAECVKKYLADCKELGIKP